MAAVSFGSRHMCAPLSRQHHHRISSSPSTAPRQRHQLPPCGRRMTRGVSRIAMCAAAEGAKVPKVKICGVTNAADATLAAEAGADFVGIILWPGTKRAVTLSQAKPIVNAVRAGGAEPVAVFVDEDARGITASCGALGITLAQLHGARARQWFPHLRSVESVYVVNSTPEGEIETELPSQITPPPPKQPAWVLLDGLTGGSGQALDWNNLKVPTGEATNGWILAGGLNSGNVAEAVAICQPDVVDVSSGVAGPDGIKKDPEKVRAFISAATGLAPDECRTRRDRAKLERIASQS
eukprot:CAMPEP_0206149846 /NCGR_PEP_ID=MMETSP1473-20131121/37994_1 /ASSEMBLY_ACC=CAM_ASM_001109 /TAXON_ID=1461547 /ORGANISM="Stichococcus sp, Strain RCC1054" /LENGTH=294 /DNA_ID=CAMNT_0053547329 /DNA_START=460 /DNA_END=1344 /DNA_ORIENTATION=+